MTASPRTTSSIGNCTIRQCQQLDDTILPTNSNCTKVTCNKLVPDELDELRMQDESNNYFAQYCDGSSVKCYSFSAAQLPYARYRTNNPICQIHNCKPATTSCGAGVAGIDDTLNISNQGTTYTNLYTTYVNVGQPLTDTTFCNPVICKPVIYTPYQCSSDASGNPTVRNSSCDSNPNDDPSADDGSTCATTACPAGSYCKKDLGFCYKTVDCNNAANASRSECIASGGTNTSDTDLTDDTNSWFYRPSPPNKAYANNDPNQGYRNNSFCYTQDEMKNQPDNSGTDGCANGSKWGCQASVNLGLFTINLGYFHMQWGPDDRTRSPEKCNTPKNGGPGVGITYLCGNKGNIYSPISSSSAYYQGYVDTAYLDGSDSISNVRVCLRFKNALRTDDVTMSDSETCGSRECAISCAFNTCKGQMCGGDKCRTLAVQYSNSKECAMNNDMFLNENSDKKCSENIGDFIRVRAVQYGHKICAFVDTKSQTAYNNIFFNGNEKLDNGISCISGTYNATTGKCDGSKNTNDDQGLADRWRTMLKVRYTSGNITKNGISGFYQKDGKFIPAQECVQVPLTTAPPDLHNLGTSQNSLKLFSPPLYIRNANIIRGGSPATDTGINSTYGTTDFLYPEIVVQFGTTTKTLSIGAGYSGEEVTKDPQSFALDSTALTTVVNGVTYSVGLLLKKIIDSNTNKPQLCLYQRLSNTGGFSDVKIDCVDRALPEINNAGTDSATTIGVRKISITGSTVTANVLNASNVYGDASISYAHCYDNSCTNSNIATLTNTDPNTPSCSGVNENNLEKYKICAQRSYCSQLWKECMENEIAIQNISNGNPTSSQNAIRNDCQSRAMNCNAMRGLGSSSASLIDQTNSGNANSSIYGWFNELCIVSGFESKLKKVYAQDIPTAYSNSSTIGRCKTVGGTCDTSGLDNASQWGAGKTCDCLTYNPNLPIAGYSTSRTQTAREAGLCVDIPTPKICRAINYGGDTYNTSSQGGTAYTNNGGTVDTRHAARWVSDVGASTNGGAAEYPASVVGMNNVAGTCNGFWQSQTFGSFTIKPVMSCASGSSAGQWSGATTNQCIRYSCPAITTGNPSNDSDVNGNYANLNYAIMGETSDSTNEAPQAAGDNFGITYADVTIGTKGSSNGYAVWEQYTKVNDFLQTSTGSSGAGNNTGKATCIAGYGGTAPTRSCDQLGIWKTPNSSCARLFCSPPSMNYNPTSNDSAAWQKWSTYKGATFGVKVSLNGTYPGAPIVDASGNPVETHNTPASRSTSGVTPGSTRKGYCNTRLGFFNVTSGLQPEMDCLYNGTWNTANIRNACLTSCDAINSPVLSDAGGNDGNAIWPKTNLSVGSASTVASSTSCAAGYYPYPYSHYKNTDGTTISPAPAVQVLSTANRTKPQRSCQSVTVVGGTANLWSATDSTCINKCPGYAIDPREGAGKTTYTKSGGATAIIKWNSISPGATDIQTTAYTSEAATTPTIGTANVATQTAADYTLNRSNGYFIVTRTCNADYTWSAPVVQCATNNGTLNHNKFGTTLGSSPSTSQLMSSFISLNNSYNVSACETNYGGTSLPTYKCQADSSNYIDKYYYAKTSGSDCTMLTCSIAANSSTLSSGNSYYNVSSTGTLTGNVNDTLGLVCDANYEYSGSTSGDGTCSQTSGTTQPQMKCQISANGLSASWVKINDCKACSTCNSTDNSTMSSGGGNSYSASNSCNSFSETLDNMVTYCNTNATYSVNSGSTVNFGIVRERKCKVNGKCSGNERNVCLGAQLICIDGKFSFSTQLWPNIGGADQSCGTSYITCRDYSVSDNC